MWVILWNIVVDLASVVALIITIYVALKIRAIRKGYLLIGRAPAQLNALSDNADRLTSLWDDTEANHEEIVRTFGDIEVSLRSLQISVEGDLKHTTKKLHAHVRQIQGLPPSAGRWRRRQVTAAKASKIPRKEVVGLYNELVKLVSNVQQDIENQSWVSGS